jgi:cytochrome c553
VCTQKPGESLRDFIQRFSKRCTELPSVAQSEIVHAFIEGTTCRDLVRELGRSPPVDSNKLFDIATSFASGEEAVGAIFDGKKVKRVDDAPAEGIKSKEPQQKHKRGKKARSCAARHARRGAMTTGTRPSLLTQLEGVLERSLEAPAYSTTC